jgi:hypothetical protein
MRARCHWRTHRAPQSQDFRGSGYLSLRALASPEARR